MLDTILRSVFRQRLIVILAGAVILIAGALAWMYMPIDAFPDVTNVQVMILTEAPGLAPSEVERLVTFPIELEMAGLPGTRWVRSLSKSGLSQVVVVFEDDVDTYFARQVVFERLSGAKGMLPEGLTPELGPISTGLGEIYQYTLEAGHFCPEHPRVWSKDEGTCPECDTALERSQLDLMDLRTIQTWLVAPQLRRLSGVNEVNSLGGFVREFQVLPDPAKLTGFGVTLRQILEALAENNANVGGGFIVKDWEQSYVVSRGLLRSASDIGRIVLAAEGGTPVYIKDVADVRVGGKVRQGSVTRDGEGEVVVGMVVMLKGSNSRDVVQRVREEVPGIQNSLPPGVRMEPFYDRTELIEACIRTISRAILQGGIFVVVVLFIILWDLRAALTVALSLPLAVSVAFLLMGWQGVTANLMSLGGLAIALGMIVDASIVMTENIARHLRAPRPSASSPADVALDAAREVARPVAFAVGIIILVFLPLFTLESLEGKMFKPLSLTMCFAMVGSLVIALTVIPAIASVVVRRTGGGGEFILRPVRAAHGALLGWALGHRWRLVALGALFLLGSFLLLRRMGTEFLPDLDEGALAINIVRLPTASLEGSKKVALEVERRLKAKFPQIRTVVTKTGQAEIAEDPMGPEQSDVFVMLKPRKEWQPSLTKDDLVRGIVLELEAIPGIRAAVSQPIALRVNELVSGIKSDVAIKIFGDDLDVLRVTAERVAPILADMGGQDVKVEQISGFSQIEIQIDRGLIARHKINVADVNDVVEIAFGGKVATHLYEGERRFDVTVRFPEEHRKDLRALREVLVPSPLGHEVPLGQLAVIREVEAPAQIGREDARRRILVECNVRDRDLGGFVRDARGRLAAIEAEMPPGYRFVLGGQFENQERAMKRLSVVVPVALGLIFFMLYGALRSFRAALLILLNLPFAVCGGILAIYIFGIHLSVPAFVGFIALLGLAVENGVVLVAFCEELRRRGRSARDAVLEATGLRLRPLIMTTMTTVLGLLPMLYATGPGSEIQKPLVAVIFGGLLSCLALTLLLLPVVYVIVSRDEAAKAA